MQTRSWNVLRNWSGFMESSKAKDMGADMAEARENARSFPGLIPPPGAKEIGREKRGKDTVIYYADGKGNYWYNTESQIALEIEMSKAQSRRKGRKRRAFSSH